MNQFYKTYKKEILLFLLMLTLELAIIFFLYQRSGSNNFSRGDGFGYWNIALNLTQHKTFSFRVQLPFIPDNYRPPVYPLFLALIYLIFNSFTPAIFIGAAIFALSAPIVYLIGKEIFHEKIAFVSALIFAVEPWAIFQAGFVVAEQIFMPIFLLSVYFFCRYLSVQGGSVSGGKSRRNYLYSAVFLQGLAALTRPISIFFILIFLIFIFIIELKSSLRQLIKTMALVLAIFILVLSPWLIRNKIILNTWQFSTATGINLYFGDYAMLEKYLGKISPSEDMNEIARRFLGVKTDIETLTVENSSKLTVVALEEIKANSGSFLAMHLKAIPLFLFKNSYGNIFFDLGIVGSDIQSKIGKYFFSNNNIFDLIKSAPLGSKVLLLLDFFWPTVILLAIFGIFKELKRNPHNLILWFFILWILYFSILTASSRDISRYKLIVNAPLFMLAVAGFYKIFNFFKNHGENS